MAPTKPPDNTSCRFRRGRPFFGRASVGRWELNWLATLQQLVLPAAFSCATFVANIMADFVQVPVVTNQGIDALDPPRHTALVRLTHWISAISFFALIESGIAILKAQPALFWGETGFFGDPSLVNLPLLQNERLSGTGRSLHFFAAWIWVMTGGIYFLPFCSHVIFAATCCLPEVSFPGELSARPYPISFV